MLDLHTAKARLSDHDQTHVLRWLDTLDADGQHRLLSQLETIDLEWLDRVLKAAPDTVEPQTITPYEAVIPLDEPGAARAVEVGEAALEGGRVGVLLVAGGQGTRLGFDGPKGAYPLGAVSGRTLYQMHAERVAALGRRYGITPPLYLMTSDANHHQTVALFEQAGWFGLPRDRVRVFPQGLAPAVDEQGKILMAAPDRIVMSPNGNGGLFAALDHSGALAHMAAAGVDVVSYIQVDNPLSLSADPKFVGYHLLQGSAFSCKAIPKTGPKEKVGCYARVGGRLRIVEYTEMPAALAEQRGPDGALVYGHSNPGLFVWSRAFIEAQARREDLPFHKAHKKIPHLDASGALVRPEQPCGYKLEAFAMDTLPDAERSLVLECRRAEEFAPVKNADGADSPRTAQAQMTALYQGWIRAAGGQIVDPEAAVEISPLYALDAPELQERHPAGLRVDKPLYLSPERPSAAEK